MSPSSPSGILALQRLAGNAAVSELLQTERYQLSAVIRTPSRDQDASGNDEPGPEASEPAVRRPVTPGRDLAVGETAELPEFVSSYPEEGEADAISANLTYSPSVTVLPDVPKAKDEFGYTWGNHVRTKDGRIHRGDGGFEVTQNYENPITIKVYADKGPHGQTNIESENDPNIKASKYPDVVADLTPRSNNRPPRHQFWSRDLTLVHEQFHATDGQRFCRQAVADAQATLNKQTASSKDEVIGLLAPIVNQVVQARGTGMAFPGNEDRAYADGAGAYKDRADKIKALGTAGKYASLGPEEAGERSDTALAAAETGSEPSQSLSAV